MCPLPCFLDAVNNAIDIPMRAASTLPVRRGFIIAGLLCMMAAVGACGNEETTMQEKTIEQVLRENTDSLMALPGVVGTAQGECAGEPCIKVLVVEKTPDLLEKIPTVIDGYAVELEPHTGAQVIAPLREIPFKLIGGTFNQTRVILLGRFAREDLREQRVHMERDFDFERPVTMQSKFDLRNLERMRKGEGCRQEKRGDRHPEQGKRDFS